VRKYSNEHYRFRYNTILFREHYAHNSLPNDWKLVNDRFVNSLSCRCDDERIPKASVTNLWKVIQSDFSDDYNPVR
jgi:hypothetical protein